MVKGKLPKTNSPTSNYTLFAENGNDEIVVPDISDKKPEAQGLTGSPLKSTTLFKSPYFKSSYEYPYNPDPLVQGNTYSIYEEMRQDEQCKVALSLKKDFVVCTGWEIVCENKDIKYFVENALKNINESMTIDASFEEIIRDMLSAYDYGFSLSEPVYELKDFEGKSLYWYKTIKTRPPHGFLFHIDDYGNITEIEQQSTIGPKFFNPSLFLHHVYQQDFGNPFGQSDLFSAHAAWKAKKFISRFMNMYLERFASPTVVGKYKNGLTSGEIARFHAMIESIQQNTSLTINEDNIVEFIQTSHDASDTYIKALEYFNLQIARSILVPDLLGIGGAQTSGGSYSLGDKHFKMFLSTIEKDRRSLARKLTIKIVRPLVKTNFGDYPCEFRFMPFPDENMTEMTKIWISAVNSSKFKPNPEEINHLRKITGFPEGEVQEQVVAPNPLFGPQNGKPGMPGMPDKEDTGEEEEKAEKETDAPEDVKEEKVKENALMEGNVLLFRQLSAYETKVNFNTIKRTLEVHERNIKPDVIDASKAIINDFIAQVKDKHIIKRGSIEALIAIQPHFLKPMNAVFKSHFKTLFNETVNQARRELFRDSAKKFAAEDLLPETVFDLLEQETFKIVGDYATLITKKGRDIIVQGIKDGLGEMEIIRLVREAMENASDNWIGTVVRTKTTEIMNDARKSYWDNDPIAKQLVDAYQFSAILDDRTSAVCEELDGQIFEKGAFIDRVTPPLHFNCRSLLVPITRFEDYENDINFVPEGKEPTFDELKKLGGNLIVGE